MRTHKSKTNTTYFKDIPKYKKCTACEEKVDRKLYYQVNETIICFSCFQNMDKKGTIWE